MRLVWAGVVVSVVVGFGFLLFVVPGIIFALWFSLTVPTIIVEDIGVSAAMGRSKKLVGGNLGKVFVVGFVILAISFVLSGSFNFVGGMAGVFIGGQSYALRYSIQTLFSVAASILGAPIGAAAYILLYYDMRIRKEGFDLEMLAASMGASVDSGGTGYVEG
jgi:hypothetical protein